MQPLTGALRWQYQVAVPTSRWPFPVRTGAGLFRRTGVGAGVGWAVGDGDGAFARPLILEVSPAAMGTGEIGGTDAAVDGANPQLKVLSAVVDPVPVLVVDRLSFDEGTPEDLFHDETMLGDGEGVGGGTNENVAVAVDPTVLGSSGAMVGSDELRPVGPAVAEALGSSLRSLDETWLSAACSSTPTH